MKHLFLTALFALSATASATPQSYGKIATWIQKQIGDRKGVDINGVTPDGKPCGLYLTDLYAGEYYVVVGLQHGKDNDYIGMRITPDTHKDMQIVNGVMSFYANDSWGNDSIINIVNVELNADGTAVYAKGVSDIKTVECRLNGTTGSR